MRRSDALFAVAAAVGLAAFVTLYGSAFPTAAIELKLSRSEIRQRADSILRAQGFDPDTFLTSLTFSARGDAAVFLQRVKGLDETVRFAREVLPLWSWDVRWFRSGAKEEFYLDLGPDGTPIAFEHVLPETAPGDSLAQDSALVLARAFVVDRLGLDLSEWNLVDRATTQRERRVDHTFTWEREGSRIEWRPNDPEAGTASLRVDVSVQGSEVDSFSRYLEVPEAFLRAQARETAAGALLAILSAGAMLGLGLAALVVGFLRQRYGRVRWRWALVPALALAGAGFLTGLLSFPLLKAEYTTEVPYEVFVALGLLGLLFVGALYGLVTWVAGAVGVSVAEETFPESLRGFRDWMARRFATPAAAAEVLRGYAVAFAFLGYLTAFYYVGTRRLGVWIPADSPHSDLLGMTWPWLVPALVALQASVSEEFLLRLFAIPWLKRVLRVTFLALLVPAAIWAFGHSNYPVYPVYVRGIELTFAGLAFGWVFLRHGIVTMLVAHFAIDAILIAMPFLRAQGGSYVAYGLAALVCAALPLLVPAVAARRAVQRMSKR